MRTIKIVLAIAVCACFSLNAAAADKGINGFGISSAGITTPAPANPSSVEAAPTKEELALWNGYLDAYFSETFGGVKAKALDIEANKAFLPPGEVVDRINLAEVVNRKLKTKLKFKIASGDMVYVSGAKSINCEGGGEDCSEQDRAFLLFHTDSGETIFLRGKDIANFSVFMKKEQDKLFKGDATPYTIKLAVKPLAIRESVLKVERKGKTVLSFSLNQLAEALNEKAVKLNAGAHHNFFFNDEVVQDTKGNAHFGPGRQLTFSPLSDDPVQFVSEKAVTAAGVTLPVVEKQYGFRIVNGFLEIYKL